MLWNASYSFRMRRAMSEQGGNHRPRGTNVPSILLLFLPLFTTPSIAGEINSCKYLVVADFTSDPYGIAKELRARARAKGFVVISAVSEVQQVDVLRTCVM